MANQEEFERKIAELMSKDLSALEVDDIISALSPYTIGHKISVPRFAAGLRLYRARAVDHVEHVRELSYPPPELTRIGRANRDGRPIFYASTARPTVFHEIDVKPDTTCLVSRWKTTAELMVNHVGYHNDVFSSLSSKREHPSWDGRHNPHETHPESSHIWNALARLFIEKAHPDRYKISAAVTECMLGTPLNGLLYPSVAMFGNGDNLAIETPWADRNIEFIGVEKVKINGRSDGSIQIEVVDYATSSDGVHLQWHGRTPKIELKKQGDQIYVSRENGDWIYRDIDGNIVDPV